MDRVSPAVMLTYYDAHNEPCAQRLAPYALSLRRMYIDIGNVKRFYAEGAPTSTRYQHHNALRDYGVVATMGVKYHHGAKMILVKLAETDFITADMIKEAFRLSKDATVVNLVVRAHTEAEDPLFANVVFAKVDAECYVKSVEFTMPLDIYAQCGRRIQTESFTSLEAMGAAICADVADASAH
jgi:hypothetical protein